MNCRRGSTANLRGGVLWLALFAALFASPGAAGAPMSLTQAQFDAQVGGLTVTVEDFEGFAAGDFASPFVIANGSYASASPRVQGSLTLCGDADQCLFDSASAGGVRTFGSLPVGSQFWGVDVHLVDGTDTLKLTVSGVGGDLELEASGSGFLGFADPLGLLSITIQNLGTDLGGGNVGIGNYSFDNVRVAPAANAVPAPGALALLGIAIMGAAWSARRRSRKK